MKITLLKEKEAPLLSRKRMSFEIDYSGDKTPDKGAVKKFIATSQKIKEELISIRHIYPRFGETKAKAIVHVYSTAKDKERFEPKKKKEEKKAEEKTEAPKEAPKEEKKEEAPKEEKKEEVKPEEKADAKEESKEQKAE